MIYKNKKLWIFFPIVISLVFIIGIVIGAIISRQNIVQNNLMLLPKNDKISTIIKYIDNEYVDTVDINKLTEKVIPLLLKELDPHSLYIPAKELVAVNEPLQGKFSGIGVEFNIANDTIMVVNTIPNGPSKMVGVMAGDRIIAVNDKNVAGIKITSDSVVKLLKGPKNTKVKITVFRKPNTETDFLITRNDIKVNSVDVSYLLNNTTGYIKINQFGQDTYQEFVEASIDLINKGMKSLIIDLRDNTGGYLEAVIPIADELLAENKLIVYTKGKSQKTENVYSNTGGILERLPVAILIDEISASASEILAGAIQDNDRGIIVGRRSFGKGLVQQQIQLKDKSALRLTIARYYTPTGRCIQKAYNNGTDDYYDEINYRYLRGEFEDKNKIKQADSLKYITPKGKVLYGGGGITPDIFVPIDTSGFTQFYAKIRNKGLIHKFAFEYSDRNRAKLQKIKTIKDMELLLDKYNMFKEFIKYTSANGITEDKKQISKSKQSIDVELKALIVRNYFREIGFYSIIRRIDNPLKVALDSLSNTPN